MKKNTFIRLFTCTALLPIWVACTSPSGPDISEQEQQITPLDNDTSLPTGNYQILSWTNSAIDCEGLSNDLTAQRDTWMTLTPQTYQHEWVLDLFSCTNPTHCGHLLDSLSQGVAVTSDGHYSVDHGNMTVGMQGVEAQIWNQVDSNGLCHHGNLRQTSLQQKGDSLILLTWQKEARAFAANQGFCLTDSIAPAAQHANCTYSERIVLLPAE